ncbi:hypothetical protein [Nonomuraea aridisoli]|uniref:Uncharacterized protein n=1 Tax=Nonomuraea aridisoli TaxID=2070368 RepID=A0A2W2EXY0_9ACTN|nr:hypothetical protein [Nonomuraea aridisoli]PZG17358.1 hypothetical protein C1J01_18155 [Nonomuraea aridisoli]
MITVVIFGLLAVCALETVLGLALAGLAVAELVSFLRRHPQGPAGGVRQLATSARAIWPYARRVLARRTGTRLVRWRRRPGQASTPGPSVRRPTAGRAGRLRPPRPPRADRSRLR